MALQVWLPLNGDLKQQGLKKYNLSMFRGSEVYNNNGKIGKCFYANGVNTIKILNIIPDFYNYSAYSLCAWFYIEARNTSHTGCGIISAGNWNSQVLNLGLSDWSTDHYTRLRISGTSWARTYTYDFALNTWYHVVVSSDNSKTYAYVNGMLIGDSQASFLPTSIEGNDMCIGGATYYAGMQFFGRINDVRIYNHCLSEKEVKEISQGLVLHYLLNNNHIGNENLLLNSLTPTSGNGATGVVKSIENGIQKIVASNPNSNWVTFANHNTTLNLSKGDIFTFSLMIKSPDSNKKPTVYFQSGMGYFSMQGTMSPNWSIIYYTGTWNIDNLTTNIHLGFSSAPGTYYIKYFKLEKGNQVTPWAPNTTDNISNIYNNSIIQDVSGYNNNGTVIGNTSLNIVNNRYDISMKQVNGQYIRVNKRPAECMPKDAITVNIWQYATTWSNPISCTEGGGWNFENSSGIRFPVYISGVGYKVAQSTITPASTLNAWHMLTGTMDKDNIKIYYDGEEVGTIAKGSTNGIGYANNYIFIGGEAGGNSTSPANSAYAGNISDVRIYATALSADDIKELYRTSKIVSGTTLTARDLE